MNPLGLSSSINDSFTNYFNTMKEIILSRVSDESFVGNITFEVNIKYGKIQNINIGEKRSVKI